MLRISNIVIFCFSDVSNFTVYANIKVHYICAFTVKISVGFSSKVPARFKFECKIFTKVNIAMTL